MLRCSRRRAPHGPAPRACALLFRALPRGQAVASASVDVPPEAAPARRPRAATSRGGARAHSSPSFQRPLGAPAPHGRCAHPSQPRAPFAHDPSGPAQAPGPASLPPRCASERRVCRPAHCPNLEARFPRKDRRRERRKSEHVRSVRLTLRLSPTSTCMSGSRNCAAQSSSRRAESPAQPAPTMAGRRARHRTARPQRRQVFQVWPHVNILPLMYL